MTGGWDEQNPIENERKAEQAPVLNHLSDQDQSLPLLSFSGALFPAFISAFFQLFLPGFPDLYLSLCRWGRRGR